jgi:hypothetical protein
VRRWRGVNISTTRRPQATPGTVMSASSEHQVQWLAGYDVNHQPGPIGMSSRFGSGLTARVLN